MLLAIALSVLATGCRTSGMVFAKSGTLKIVAPLMASSVTLPLTVTWTASDTEAPAGSRFAAFVDRNTISPGESLSAVLPDACKRQPTSCNEQQELEQAGVFVTATPSVLLRTLPTNLTHGTSGQEFHSVTIIVVDHSGNRLGERFIRTEFEYERKGL